MRCLPVATQDAISRQNKSKSGSHVHLVLHLRPDVIVVRGRYETARYIEAELLQVSLGTLHRVYVAEMNGVKCASGEEDNTWGAGGCCRQFAERPLLMRLRGGVGMRKMMAASLGAV